jgi:malonate transporter and related proteins
LNAILTTVFPVFGLICLGYACAKAGIIGEQAGRGITLFVFNIAIPAFLFRTVANMAEPQSSPWWLWVAFFGGIAVVWASLYFWWRCSVHGRRLWQSGLAGNTTCNLAFW